MRQAWLTGPAHYWAVTAGIFIIIIIVKGKYTKLFRKNGTKKSRPFQLLLSSFGPSISLNISHTYCNVGNCIEVQFYYRAPEIRIKHL